MSERLLRPTRARSEQIKSAMEMRLAHARRTTASMSPPPMHFGKPADTSQAIASCNNSTRSSPLPTRAGSQGLQLSSLLNDGSLVRRSCAPVRSSLSEIRSVNASVRPSPAPRCNEDVEMGTRPKRQRESDTSNVRSLPPSRCHSAATSYVNASSSQLVDTYSEASGFSPKEASAVPPSSQASSHESAPQLCGVPLSPQQPFRPSRQSICLTSPRASGRGSRQFRMSDVTVSEISDEDRSASQLLTDQLHSEDEQLLSTDADGNLNSSDSKPICKTVTPVSAVRVSNERPRCSVPNALSPPTAASPMPRCGRDSGPVLNGASVVLSTRGSSAGSASRASSTAVTSAARCDSTAPSEALSTAQLNSVFSKLEQRWFALRDTQQLATRETRASAFDSDSLGLGELTMPEDSLLLPSDINTAPPPQHYTLEAPSNTTENRSGAGSNSIFVQEAKELSFSSALSHTNRLAAPLDDIEVCQSALAVQQREVDEKVAMNDLPSSIAFASEFYTSTIYHEHRDSSDDAEGVDDSIIDVDVQVEVPSSSNAETRRGSNKTEASDVSMDRSLPLVTRRVPSSKPRSRSQKAMPAETVAAVPSDEPTEAVAPQRVAATVCEEEVGKAASARETIRHAASVLGIAPDVAEDMMHLYGRVIVDDLRRHRRRITSPPVPPELGHPTASLWSSLPRPPAQRTAAVVAIEAPGSSAKRSGATGSPLLVEEDRFGQDHEGFVAVRQSAVHRALYHSPPPLPEPHWASPSLTGW